MSKKKIIIGAVVLVVIVAAIIGLNMNNKKSTAIEVETAKVERKNIVQTVNSNGRIQPVLQVKISADVSAKIMRLGVKEGDWAEKGDFLIELDRERHLAAVESAVANVNSAQANAKLAKENMLKTEKDYKRMQELFTRKLESQANLDATYAAYKVEKARYESVLEGVQQAKASLKQSNDDLSKTTIYAPMSGTISTLNKEVGEIALGSQFQEDVIMIISNLSGMEALVDVDENDIVSISIGDSAKIEVDAIPGLTFRGEVTEIASSAKVSGQGSTDQKTDFEVKVGVTGIYKKQVEEGTTATNGHATKGDMQIPSQDPLSNLRPGMTATSDIMVEAHDNTLSIPIQSVAVRTVEQLKKHEIKAEKEGKEADAGKEKEETKYNPDKDGFVEIVFVVRENKAYAVPVKTGIQSDTHIEILEGLQENDEVVIGNYRAISKDLQNNTEVKVKEKTDEK
ncbi:MAG: efflux RND transporter periplasmic adaptor subunit [Calditrichaeota bacterium]|nr:MAG: efflux RND transporter periplasmic adaptor subunit [Calditrichota bacterium]